MLRHIRISLFLFLLVTLSCSLRNIPYREKHIHKFHKAGYQISLNNEIINPEYYFLNKDNIKKVSLSKSQKLVSIYQKDTSVKYLQIANVVDSIKHSQTNNQKNIRLLVLNGIPFSTDDFNKIKVETKAIKNIIYLHQDSIGIISCASPGDIILMQMR